ncbi:hypothetical protein GCM10023189_17070 [Nibrella saemangeumensis]|uniref:HMA domain-containing protein n=1 Tax=Nibrella saemangeumensis TaxID=1084526 RepID=A0ABP8MPF4_9BACT
METLKFKTNIKCGACVATVTPHLNKLEGVERWDVDLQNPNRILTVEADSASEQEVVKAITEAGYKAEAV